MEYTTSQAHDYMKYRIQAITSQYYLTVTLLGYLTTLNLLGFLYESHTATWSILSVGAVATLILGVTAWRWVMNRQKVKSFAWILKLTDKQLHEIGVALVSVKGFVMFSSLTRLRSLLALGGLISIIAGTMISEEGEKLAVGTLPFNLVVSGGVAFILSIILSSIVATMSNRIKTRIESPDGEGNLNVEQEPAIGTEPPTVEEGKETPVTTVKKPNPYRTWDDKPKYGEDAH